MVNPYFVPNSLLNLVGAFVALAVSYYAFRYGRVTGSGFLKLVSIGFALLGIGLMTQASAFLLFAYNVGRISDREVLVYASTILYLALQAAAFVVIAVGYIWRTRVSPAPKEPGAALAVGAFSSPLLFGTHVLEVGQLVILVLLGFVVFQEALIYSEQRNRLSLAVLGGFAFILLGHVGILAASLLTSGLIYLLGDVAQLAGFGLWLLFVLWSRPVGPT